MTIEIGDLEQMTAAALEASNRRLSAPGEEAHREERETARLEALAEQIYALTAAAARREPDVAATAALWQVAVQQCDAIAARLQQVAALREVPDRAYDRVLDIRSAARELQVLHTP